MQKRLFLTLGVLLSSCLPAGAQTRLTRLGVLQERPASRTTLLAAATTHFPLTTLPPTPPLAERPARLAALLALMHNRDRSLERLSPVEVFKTPFVRQMRLPVAPLWGGRLQLDGFASTSRMENVLGPGGRVPRANTSYGISLAFRLGRGAHADHLVERCRCLASVVGAGRGCGL